MFQETQNADYDHTDADKYCIESDVVANLVVHK